MLVILNDPASITGRSRYELDRTVSVQANIERHMSGGAGCRVLINGEEIDPVTDPRMDAPPQVGDLVTVAQRPEGVETWVLIISAALAVYSYSMIPKQPVGNPTNESPNNSLAAQTNIARPYMAVPDVYGSCRVWPDLIQPSVIEYIDNVKFVTEWLCVSRGKGDITAVKYADTPITDIDGASYTVFNPAATPSAYPEQNDTTLTNVVEAFKVADVNGQDLRYSSTYPFISRGCTSTATNGNATFTLAFTDGSIFASLKAAAGTGTAHVAVDFPRAIDENCSVDSYVVASGIVTFTFTALVGTWANATGTFSSYADVQQTGTPPSQTVGPFTMPLSCDALRWNTVFLRGLTQEVQIKAEWWKVDSGGVEIGGTRQNQTFAFTDDTFEQRFFTTEVTPTAGAGVYKIEFTRQNAEAVDGSDIAKLEDVFAIKKYSAKTLPGVTVVKVVTKATIAATGIRERKFNLQWARHVRTLSATTLSASRNFARIMAHVWSLSGGDIAELDTTKLQTINTALGESADVLRFDGTFDDADMSLGERLQRIAFHARCVMWRDGTMWTVTRDELRTTPELQLDYRNLAADGDSNISYASHLPASNDGVEVEYVDEATQATKAYVRFVTSSGAVVSGTPINPRKFQMPACRTTTQATNRAYLEAYKLLYQRISVTDKALADGLALGVGSLIKWVDPNDFAGDDGLQAGEVLAISGSTITTSEALNWKGQTTGRMLFTGVDGLYTGASIVVTPATGGAVLASVPGGLYVRSATRQLGSRYAFSPGGLTDAEIKAAGLYLVTDNQPAADGTTSLAFANYDERFYTED